MNNLITAGNRAWPLFRKDIKIVKRYVWIAIPLFLSYGAMFVIATNSYLLACSVFSVAAALGPIWIEAASKSDLLIASLPVSRRHVVTGRYVSSLAFVVIGAAATLLYGLFLDVLFSGASFAIRFRGVSILALLATTSVVLGIFLPFYFGLGLGKGIAAFSLSVVSSVAAMVIVSVTAHAVKTGSIASFSPSALFLIATRVIEFLRRPLGIALFYAGAALAYRVSWSISIVLHKRRDF